NAVLIIPTQAFIDALPYQKIPDRHDFANMDVATRQKFWQQATDAGYRLAEQLQKWLESGEIRHKVQRWED
ncbi:MAG: alpha/beta hydrolase, partial [Gammaproteobacteria bacterium]|nr:alpha/beta hydrolase [Gammaproteobacteria bacterium]